jgi:asparagine synthase (glutamine-hydrolysing)
VNDTNILLGTIREAVLSRREPGQDAVLLSGGLDSAIVAALAKEEGDIRAYTVGLGHSHDMDAGMRCAGEIGVPWGGIMITREDVRLGIVELCRLLDTSDPVKLSYELPLFFACRSAEEEVLLCGQGADELFGGYARYVDMRPDERRAAMQSDTARLLADGIGGEGRIASEFGKRIAYPYLDARVQHLAKQLPDELIVGDGERKVALRQVASALGLSAAKKSKKAAQYGSGIMAEMKAMAKDARMPLGKYMESLREG